MRGNRDRSDSGSLVYVIM